jgi:hypothetical protein
VWAGIFLRSAIFIGSRIAARHRPIAAQCPWSHGTRLRLRCLISSTNRLFQFGRRRARACRSACAAGRRALSAAARRVNPRSGIDGRRGLLPAGRTTYGSVGWWLGFASADVRPERLNLFIGQGAPFAGRQVTQHDRPFAHTDQAQNLVAKLLSHLANLALAAFVQYNTHPHAILAALKHINPGRSGRHTVHEHSAAPLTNRLGRGHLIEQRAILFFDLIAGMREPLGQLAIVGHQQQTFAVIIQPAN